jgi:hypothetical protein
MAITQEKGFGLASAGGACVEKRAEWIQFALAVLTLVLLEEWAHWKLQERG